MGNTKFFVLYRKVSIPSNEVNGDCGAQYTSSPDWSEFDCATKYPCNITPLDQHSSYVFKVKALNTKGNSEYSNEITKTTKVSKIPQALQGKNNISALRNIISNLKFHLSLKSLTIHQRKCSALISAKHA